jgi:hypothetical protein
MRGLPRFDFNARKWRRENQAGPAAGRLLHRLTPSRDFARKYGILIFRCGIRDTVRDDKQKDPPIED